MNIEYLSIVSPATGHCASHWAEQFTQFSNNSHKLRVLGRAQDLLG